MTVAAWERESIKIQKHEAYRVLVARENKDISQCQLFSISAGTIGPLLGCISHRCESKRRHLSSQKLEMVDSLPLKAETICLRSFTSGTVATPAPCLTERIERSIAVCFPGRVVTNCYWSKRTSLQATTPPKKNNNNTFCFCLCFSFLSASWLLQFTPFLLPSVSLKAEY